jgi:hypothetical protein
LDSTIITNAADAKSRFANKALMSSVCWVFLN